MFFKVINISEILVIVGFSRNSGPVTFFSQNFLLYFNLENFY